MLRLNQKGFSLPMVMVIMAIVVANTVYFMGVNKNSTGSNYRVATNIAEENEKRRISANLADKDVCGNLEHPVNFYNKNIVNLLDLEAGTNLFALTGLARESDTGHPFLKIGGEYINKTHVATRFYFWDSGNTNPQTKYSLRVEYTLKNSASGVLLPSSGAGIKQKMVITIPLFVELAGGLVTRCYARSDQETVAPGATNVEESIKAACDGTAAELIKSGSNILGCKHEIATLTCPNKTILNTMVIVSPQQTYDCKANSFSCSTSPQQTFAQAVVGDGTATCGAIDICEKGAMIIRSGNGTACTKNCLTDYLWSSVALDGTPLCYERLKDCPVAGTYTKEVRPDGTVDCQPIVYKNVDCTAGKYATDMNPTVPVDPLTCAAYSKAKTCPGGKKWFTSLTSTTPTCDASYTY